MLDGRLLLGAPRAVVIVDGIAVALDGAVLCAREMWATLDFCGNRAQNRAPTLVSGSLLGVLAPTWALGGGSNTQQARKA